MKQIYTIFSCPISKGKIKRRVAKKILNDYFDHFFEKHSWFLEWKKEIAHIKVGDLNPDGTYERN